jgi:hypothetical protein
VGRNQYISKLKSRLETRYSSQDKADEEAFSYYDQSHLKDVWNPKVIGDFDAKTVGSGAVGLIVDQDVTVLDGTEIIRVNPLGGKKAEEFASQTLEPWLAMSRSAARRRQQLSAKKIQDLRLYGRAWTTVLPSRKPWAGKDFAQKKDESDDDFNKRVAQQRKSRFPIKWRNVDARGTWPVFDEDGDVVEVVEIRKVEPSRIAEEFPSASINDKEDVDVVRYANHQFYAEIIPGGSGLFSKESQELQVWEHHLGRLPYVLFEGDPMPVNPNAPRWRSAAYHVLSLVQALDETLSDIRTAARLEVVGPTIVEQDPDARAAYGGFDKDFKIKPGDTVNLFPGEKVYRLTAAVLNESLLRLLGYLKPLLDEVAMKRPALMGTLVSGESNVALNRAIQQAEVELTAGQHALQEGAAEECGLFLRAAMALKDMFPQDAETIVTARGKDAKHESKEISLNPSDIKDILEWEQPIEVSISQNLPVDEGGNITNFSVATQSGMYSKQTGREKFGGSEDPLAEEDRIKVEQIDDALHLAGLQVLQTRIYGMLQQVGAPTDQQVGERSQRASTSVQELLAQSYQDTDPEMANMIRGQMNIPRTGRGQREEQGVR